MLLHKPRLKSKPGGFTMVELVIVIVLMSLVSLAGVEVIRQSSESYLKMSNRQGLGSAARLAVERLSREFRSALPGSVRTSGDCIEFLPIEVAGTYVTAPFESAGTSMTVVRVSADLAAELGRVAIYSVGDNVFDLDAGILSPEASIGASDAGNISTVSWTGSHLFEFESPTSRFYMVSDPVSYCVDGDNLFRYSNYGVVDPQPLLDDLPTALPDRALLVNQVSSTGTPFRVMDPGLSRNAIVMIVLSLSTDGEFLQITQEAQLRNVP